ncbi:MAG: hypothetical protein AAGI11_04875 [Pseudomonadota bacterium]
MTQSAPPVTLCSEVDDFVNHLDLEESFGGHTCIDLIARLTECHYEYLYAQRYLVGKTYSDEGYGKARELLDIAMLHLVKAKWLIGGITGAFKGVRVSTDKHHDAIAGWSAAEQSLQLLLAIKAALQGQGSLTSIEATAPLLDREGTEVLRSDGFPVVPSICPVVIVSGSAYAMGYQYAEQVLEIYGDFVFREFAALRFTDERLKTIGKHEAQLAAHTPEILDMVRGWADAVSASGLPMAYENVLHMWCPTDAPAQQPDEMHWPFLGSESLLAAMYFGQQAFINKVAAASAAEPVAEGQESLVDRCSGFCAWGNATVDGRLKAASTTDHDCWMQATIVAYPEDGNNFIYTPFSVHGGWIPGLGISSMAGHPGMNNRGVAYVHHGGEIHAMEPAESWGYGVPRGACIFHGLRYANTAIEVHDQIMSYPIGNVAAGMGSVGGQWADHGNGYIFESRYRSEEHPDGLVRTQTFDHEGRGHDILYTGNSALHAGAPSGNHGHDEGVLNYDIERGWHTYDPSTFMHPNLLIASARMTAGPGGAERNRCYYRLAIPASGEIDEQWVERLYCTPAEDAPSAAQTPGRQADIIAGKYQNKASPAHRGNAFTAIMFPDDGDQGTYSGCVGPISYDLPASAASHGYFYYDETNAYWTIRLADTPMKMLTDARARATEDGERARALMADLDNDNPGTRYLKNFLSQHTQALTAGDKTAADLETLEGNQRMAGLSRALRRYTSAQVRARQVINAFNATEALPYSL